MEAGHFELRSGRNGGLVYVAPELLTDKQSESIEPLIWGGFALTNSTQREMTEA